MSKSSLSVIVGICLILFGGLCGHDISRRIYKNQTPTIAPADTINITNIVEEHDTIFVYKPYLVYSHTTDTLYVPADTVRVNDTLYQIVPIESKKYTDDKTYTAYVSGFKPSLDSIAIYNTNTIITNTEVVVKKPSPVEFSFGVGTDVKKKDEIILSPFAEAGLAYRKNRTKIEVDFGSTGFTKNDLYGRVSLKYIIP